MPARFHHFLAFTLAAVFPAFAEVQTLDTLRTFPDITAKSQWENRRSTIRQQILVSAGLWPMPEKTPLNAKIFGKIERDGYSVEKVYFQSYPGFYVAGNLYRPLGQGAGPFPAILNSHGHWEHGRLEDTDLCSNPGRCINFAKQGMIAFAFDMVGYNDTHFPETPQGGSFYGPHHEFATNDPANLLWSITLMGLQTWDCVRALDFLASLPDVDTKRLAMTGASGGGTQTMLLGAIDDRLAAQAPVVMVSHTMQGGCLCENMPGLRIRFSNMEISAAAAPRPQILVSDTRDWTKTTLEMEGPAIGGIYQLFQSSEKLRYVRYDFEHNYNKTSREAVYQWFDHWLLNKPDQPVPEVPFTKEPDKDLRVFPDGVLPPDAVSEAELIKYLKTTCRRQLESKFDVGFQTFTGYLSQVMIPAWTQTLQLDLTEHTTISSPAQKGDYVYDELEITPSGTGETLKVPRFSPLKHTSARFPTVVVLAQPDDAPSYVGDGGAPQGLARLLMDKGLTVAVVPESATPPDTNQTSLFFATYNRTRLQEHALDLVTTCLSVRHAYTNECHVVLCGSGVAGLWSIMAAPMAHAVVADCDQVDSSDDRALMAPDLFCPGIRRIDTFQGPLMASMGSPALLHNTASGFTTDHVRSAYRTLRAKDKLRIEARRLSDEEITSWIASLWFSAE